MKDTTFSSKAYGTHEYKDLTIEGRVQFDVYMALQRDHKLSSYTLNAVSPSLFSSSGSGTCSLDRSALLQLFATHLGQVSLTAGSLCSTSVLCCSKIGYCTVWLPIAY
eukprot:GHUV01047949.1.p1 GENE.GHUV01047949.1~~GHUV01047949.1.p1  ORF type:complete len:108 (-),score=29.56 GHUV01047949.1:114-437(-)